MNRLQLAPHVESALTPREREILQLIVAGRTTHEIASALSIAHGTVAVQRVTILRKVGARNAADLVRIAILGA